MSSKFTKKAVIKVSDVAKVAVRPKQIIPIIDKRLSAAAKSAKTTAQQYDLICSVGGSVLVLYLYYQTVGIPALATAITKQATKTLVREFKGDRLDNDVTDLLQELVEIEEEVNEKFVEMFELVEDAVEDICQEARRRAGKAPKKVEILNPQEAAKKATDVILTKEIRTVKKGKKAVAGAAKKVVKNLVKK